LAGWAAMGLSAAWQPTRSRLNQIVAAIRDCMGMSLPEEVRP
jgi:hypothetical protein